MTNLVLHRVLPSSIETFFVNSDQKRWSSKIYCSNEFSVQLRDFATVLAAGCLGLLLIIIMMMRMMLMMMLMAMMMVKTLMFTSYLPLPIWLWWWVRWWGWWRWWRSSPAICPCPLPPSCSSLNTRSLHLLWKPSQDSIQNTIYQLPDKVFALFRSPSEDHLYSVRDIASGSWR